MTASVRHWLLRFGEMDEDVPSSLAQLSHLTPAVQLQTPLSLGGGRSHVDQAGEETQMSWTCMSITKALEVQRE